MNKKKELSISSGGCILLQQLTDDTTAHGIPHIAKSKGKTCLLCLLYTYPKKCYNNDLCFPFVISMILLLYVKFL